MTTTAAPCPRLPSAAFVGTVGFHEGNALLRIESAILRAVDPMVEDLGASTLLALLDDFIAEAPVRLRELDALADRPETQEVFRRTAHSFKGTSGIFGLAELVRLSMELEMGTPVRSRQDGSQGDRVRELRCQFQQILPALWSVRRRLQART